MTLRTSFIRMDQTKICRIDSETAREALTGPYPRSFENLNKCTRCVLTCSDGREVERHVLGWRGFALFIISLL